MPGHIHRAPVARQRPHLPRQFRWPRIDVVGNHPVPHQITGKDHARIIEFHAHVTRRVPGPRHDAHTARTEVDDRFRRRIQHDRIAQRGRATVHGGHVPGEHLIACGAGRQHARRKTISDVAVHTVRMVSVIVREHEMRRPPTRQLPRLRRHPARTMRSEQALDGHHAVATGNDAAVRQRRAITAQRRRHQRPDAIGYTLQPAPRFARDHRPECRRGPRGAHDRWCKACCQRDVRGAAPRRTDERSTRAHVAARSVRHRVAGADVREFVQQSGRRDTGRSR